MTDVIPPLNSYFLILFICCIKLISEPWRLSSSSCWNFPFPHELPCLHMSLNLQPPTSQHLTGYMTGDGNRQNYQPCKAAHKEQKGISLIHLWHRIGDHKETIAEGAALDRGRMLCCFCESEIQRWPSTLMVQGDNHV